jgi:hypothetical protein
MTSDETLQPNKPTVMAYDLMFNQSRPARAIATNAGVSYRQHNPHVGDGTHASSTPSSGWRPSTPVSGSSSTCSGGG